MITGTLKNRMDQLWTEFWTGGITNPLTVIEQISYLMFVRMMDASETRREKAAKRKGQPYAGIYDGEDDPRRWRNLIQMGGDELLDVVDKQVFPQLRDMADENTSFGRYMSDAQLMVRKPSLLVKAVEMINDLPLTGGDTKGDLYEYLLSKLTTAGINGQFRTPRHIIRLMVDMIEPQPDWTIADPACGTGGFLITIMDYLLEHHTSSEGVIEEQVNGDKVKVYTGDLLEPYRKHIQNDMFYGFDFDATMLRIASMNLMLHGVENPNIEYADTLSNSFEERFPKEAEKRFDLIMANPPFKGSLDAGDVDPTLTGKVKTKKTELLFVVLMLRMLKLGGRCAVIVPDGVLFGSSRAHVALRKMLVENNQLHAVVKLPAGVFKPYAGVSTAILFFTKTDDGGTSDVFFYDVHADGFSLDDKRLPTPTANDLPEVKHAWTKWTKSSDRSVFGDRTKQAFGVNVDEIRQAGYDLSLNCYKEIRHSRIVVDKPKAIIARLKELENDFVNDLNKIEKLIGS